MEDRKVSRFIVPSCAVILAGGVADGGTVLVVNGDTFSGFNLKEMAEFHAGAGSAVTIGLKHVPDAGRYGRAILKDGTIEKFTFVSRYP